LFSFFYWFGMFRITLFLRKNIPERYSYLKGKDISWNEWEKGIILYKRQHEWLKSDTDNEHELLRDLKKWMVLSYRVGFYSVVYVFVSSILIFILSNWV